MARIGILGGTFDPPHNGHIVLAEAALRELDLDRIIFVPALIQPHKISRITASPDDRMKMLRLALGERDRLEISDIELQRSGQSYTVDTLENLKEMYPLDQFFLIIGADNVSDIGTWHDPERIFDLATVAAANRPGFKPRGRFAGAVELFQISPTDISSTEIRKRIKSGKSISGMVSGDVEKYILKHKLYLRK